MLRFLGILESRKTPSEFLKDVNAIIQPKYGLPGTLQAYDIITRGAMTKSGNKAFAEIRKLERYSDDIMVYHIVNVLKKYSIKPCYQIAARLMNSLRFMPLYHVEKEIESGKSKGEERLRYQYEREKREREAKKTRK